MGHYVFSDGHVAIKAWGAIRKNDFRSFKVQKPDTNFIP